jgi:D-glycero-D-manno-heptose 1,7-bisphosphate phosphatase
VSRPAVFLDRDGTLIRDLHFIGKPEQVEILAGAGDAVRRLNEAGLPVIVVTNQSGIARGYFTETDYERVQARTEDLLAEKGARIDGSFMCPHHPDFTGPCDCRKPGTLLFRLAAEALDLDTRGSWYVGDMLRDVLPARALGGRGILVPNDETPAIDIARAEQEFEVASSLDEAVGRVIESAQ